MSALRRQRQAERNGDPAGGPARAGRPAALRVIEALLWAGVAVLFVVRVAPQVRAAIGWPSGGTAAPQVTFDMLDGRPVALSSLKGQVVLVNFWATWCPPCRAEMPGIESVYEAKHAAGFTVVGVSLDQKAPPAVAAFLHTHHIAYPVAMATAENVAAFGEVNSLPTSYLIDRQGRVRYTVQGMFAGPALRAAVDRLLAERG
jgi:cytochrome c biogenesis protein CcmG, thiol:disulfide interchange protein DsbE